MSAPIPILGRFISNFEIYNQWDELRQKELYRHTQTRYKMPNTLKIRKDLEIVKKKVDSGRLTNYKIIIYVTPEIIHVDETTILRILK